LKEELLAIMSLVLVALRKLTVYVPGEITWGKGTVIWLLCGFTLFAIAKPPEKVLLASALKIARVHGPASDESDDQVKVAFWSGVTVEGTCRFDTAAAVAANTRATAA